MLKRFWLIWARTVDHRIGFTDEEKPSIPTIPVVDANISLIIRTLFVIMSFITCGFIIANVIRHW